MIRKFLFAALLLCSTMCSAAGFAKEAQWITAQDQKANDTNTWIAFRRDINLDQVPQQVLASIAVDSKYWLWINGKQVVFEGQLKRGPNPQDTYYDEVDLASFLRKGNNQIALLLVYFGKSGFSHLSSGKSGLLFSAPDISLYSDDAWQSRIHPAFGTTGEPIPNFRLSESNIRYDARQDLGTWQTQELGQLSGFAASQTLGKAGDAPWNALVLRPIPQWKDYGMKPIKYTTHTGAELDTLVAILPYNMQFTPAFVLDDPEGGHEIKIQTDHKEVSGEWGVRAEYITRAGQQTYENLEWVNGDELDIVVPHGLKVKKLMYRQTGYDGSVDGSFSCDDDFFNRFWLKGLRTLYVNMRDTFFDCPERERAQWIGDFTVLMGECFYTYGTSVHQLMRKAIMQVCDHQRADHVVYGPIPGNWNQELPAQMLASVGLYGCWNYYMNTGDLEALRYFYPHVREYLSVWGIDETGLTAERHGGWDWGDWGDNRDIRLLYAAWHYIALDAAARMADSLNKPQEAAGYRALMAKVKDGFNKCWNGTAYRYPTYTGETDDRVQALAVLSGIAGPDKYDQITQLLHTQKYASPYMEKYVMEALFQMGQGQYGMERVRERFAEMVNDTFHTTLYEGWGIGANGFGGGTTNHAWSGGVLTVISQNLMGVKPIAPGWTHFEVDPQMVTFNRASIEIPTVKGMVKTGFQKKGAQTALNITVPQGTDARLYLPVQDATAIHGKTQYVNTDADMQKAGKTCLLLPAGTYKFTF